MAEQHYVGGPTQTLIGANVLGQTDGNLLLGMELVAPMTEVTTDARAGMSEDFIQRDSYYLLSLPLVKFDRTEMFKTALSRLKSAVPVLADEGQAGDIGLMAIADGAAFVLNINFTRKDAAGNAHMNLSFPRVILDPDTNFRLDDLGWPQARSALTLRAVRDESDPPVLYTVTAIV